MSISPALNTNNILDELLSIVSSGCELTEFERARFIREANRQVSLDRQYTFKTLIAVIDRDRESVRDNSKLALDHIEQPATFTHCVFALHVMGMNSDLLALFTDYEHFFDYPDLIKGWAEVLSTVPNLYFATKMLLMLDKYKKIEAAERAVIVGSYFLSGAELAKKEFEIDSDVVGKITKFAARVADQHGNIVINFTTFEKSISGDCMNLTYFVEWSGTHMFDLNLALADLLIEHDLDRLPICVGFDLVPANNQLVKDRYAN